MKYSETANPPLVMTLVYFYFHCVYYLCSCALRSIHFSYALDFTFGSALSQIKSALNVTDQ
jgi:hypothetical protein